MSKEALIQSARRWFSGLDGQGIGPNGFEYMTKDLKAAGVGYEALDPSGQKTATEIDVEIKDRMQQGHIKSARLWFKALNDGYSEIGFKLMTDHLKAAGVGYEALDPSGKKTSTELAAIIGTTKARRAKKIDTTNAITKVEIESSEKPQQSQTFHLVTGQIVDRVKNAIFSNRPRAGEYKNLLTNDKWAPN